MSRSYRDRVDRDPLTYRDKHERRNAWKREAMTSKEDLYSVYVIINEWSPEDSGEDLSEIVDGKWFTSESEAWDDLAIIAETVSVSLDREDTSFDAPGHLLLGLTKDTYYIQELTR